MTSKDGFERAAKIRRGEHDDELPDYDVIVSWLHRCPMTWIGGLLATVVARAVAAPVFASDDALIGFVHRAIWKVRNPNCVLRDGE